jgi:hypothetical protein
MKAYEVGTEIYYTGDVANIDGNGTVTRVRPADLKYGYGETMDITLTDGREMRAIPMACFSGPGRRFWTAADRKAHYEAQMAVMVREYEERQARLAAEQVGR